MTENREKTPVSIDFGWRHQGIPVLLPGDRTVVVDDSSRMLEKALRDLSMQYYSLDRCHQCGICTEACPHTNLGKAKRFSPRVFIQKARLGLIDLAGGELWSCTTCGSCLQACPYEVPLVDIIVSLRNLVVEQGAGYVPPSFKAVLASLAASGNPWREDPGRRADWFEELAPQGESRPAAPEILLFAGCIPSFDRRGRSIARAAVQILQKAGIGFDILGNEEQCCGDSALKIGDVKTFERLREANLHAIQARHAERIYTLAPHCSHVMKTRYACDRDHGAPAKPFLLLLHELVAGGRLPLGKVKRARAVFHDPCYLSKYEGITEEPREILAGIPGLETVEMAHNGKRSLCCGAGGGGFWLDTLKGERLAEIRLDEAIEVGADMLVTACPYCLAMFETSRASDGRWAGLEILDIGELVLRSLDGPGCPGQACKPGM